MIANECHKSQQRQHRKEVADNCVKTVNDKTVVIDDTMLLILRKRRRTLYHQTCLLSVMAAFTIGLAMGVFFLPLIRLTSAKSSAPTATATTTPLDDSNLSLTAAQLHTKMHKYNFNNKLQYTNVNSNQIDSSLKQQQQQQREPKKKASYSSVSFISEDDNEYLKNMLAENNAAATATAFEMPQQLTDDAAIDNINNNNNNNDSNSSNSGGAAEDEPQRQQSLESSYERENNETLRRVIDDDIYWGQEIENRIPNGFGKRDINDWQNYLQSNVTEIIKIEQGCGRMQNRLVTFSDGVKACVRYRQNTDQIQGELFSFFLGHLLNITNLVPSTAAVIDWDSRLWLQVKQHITESQWKTSRPVVFTKWIPDLVPSNIPEQFRSLERHMSKNDIWNITMSDDEEGDDNDGSNNKRTSHILIDRLKTKKHDGDNDGSNRHKLWRKKKITLNGRLYGKFVELAQWSDLIIFDYLIANLDRVVNNLYNYQWNADIMAAPAHNLARQKDSQLLVFLDNESGLLHGYRLLKKYEVYHSQLLDDLCVFRKSTIEALRYLRDNNAGELLNKMFEQIATLKVRDVLPPLPEKSIKILADRIDRILKQVQKCQDMYSDR